MKVLLLSTLLLTQASFNMASLQLPFPICLALRKAFVSNGCLEQKSVLCYGIAIVLSGTNDYIHCKAFPCIDYNQGPDWSCRGPLECPFFSINLFGICNFGQVCCNQPPVSSLGLNTSLIQQISGLTLAEKKFSHP